MSDGMRKFYDHPDERRKWGEEIVAQGLFPTESQLIEKHFHPASAVLDVGCGGGREAFALARLGFAVTAVDYKPEFVETCQAKAAALGLQIEVRTADVLALPFADQQFDHVVMVGQLLGHIRGHDKRVAALREIRRVMRPGAALVSTNAVERNRFYRLYFWVVNHARAIYNPRGLEPYDAPVRRVGGKHQWGRAGRPIFHWYRTDEFSSDAREAGWTVAEYLRRYENETQLNDPSTSGETFYVLRKEA